ncbi:MAG: nucleoside deaminase [Bernardetiaceae bacterium]|nr:nucleoside deaminase [Bernardetiaceae bacterium]
MREAYRLAVLAGEQGEIPVGAVVVHQGKIIGRGHNQTLALHDATAHAEMVAITAASHLLGTRYLTECTLYVTLEPCVMCAGACYWAMLGQVVYGASDAKNGFSRLGETARLAFHPKTKLVAGPLQAECQALLTTFFSRLRKNNKT